LAPVLVGWGRPGGVLWTRLRFGDGRGYRSGAERE